METKIVFITIFLAMNFFTTSFGQKSIVKFQIGYGLPLSNSLLSQSTQSNTAGVTYTGVYGSYGSGLRLEGGYIHALNNTLSLEMDLAYLIGKSINATYNSSGNMQSQSNSSRFYEISPLLRAKLGGDKIKPYAAVGPVFGLGTVTADNVAGSTSSMNVNEIQRTYTGSVAIGAKSVVGAELTQGRFIFYAQVALIAMSYAPGKSEYTKYTQNGIDQLNSLTISQKQFVYTTSITTSNNATPDPTLPSEQIKFYIPLSNISMNVGVMFKI